jgi:acyl carrier protein
MVTEYKLSQENFIHILRNVFQISEEIILSADTDLSEYIQDSIDLGELLAVLKQEYNITPINPEKFSQYSKLSDVLDVINH